MQMTLSSQWLFYMSDLIALIALLLAGWSDWKTRTVRNVWPLLVLITGLFSDGAWWDKTLGFVLPILLIYLSKRITHKQSGGADIKMYVSIGFHYGYIGFCGILLLSYLCVMLVTVLQKKEKCRYVPMVTYLAVGAVLYTLINLF